MLSFACRADYTINYEATPGFKGTVKQLTEGRGCDVIFDPVGGEVFDESMPSCCAYGCRFLLCGFTSGGQCMNNPLRGV